MTLTEQEKNMRKELDMVDVAHYILSQEGTLYDFNDLLVEVVEFLGIDEDEMNDHMAQFYTDLNTDGRFISPGENTWGLRGWFAVDKINEVLTDENTEEDTVPRRSADGFDAYDSVIEEMIKEEEKEIYGEDSIDEDEQSEEVVDEEVEDDEDDLDAYRDDLDELETEEDELEGLEIQDEEDLLDDEDLDDDLDI